MEKNHAGDRRTMYVTQIVAFATGALFAAIAVSMYYERELQKVKEKWFKMGVNLETAFNSIEKKRGE